MSMQVKMNKGSAMKSNSEAGFTLIELAIVMVIFGFMVTAMFYGLSLYANSAVRGQTDEAMETSQGAILEFFSREGRYPCPADPALGPGDGLYGIEQCAAPAVTVVPGERDADDNIATIENVLIGSMPFNTLLDPDNNINTDDGIIDVPLSESLTIDGEGNKLIYAVTESQTALLTYNQTEGVINVVDENDRTVLGVADTAHFVVISMGDNGEGGYTREGVSIGNCATSIAIDDPTLPPQTFRVNEVENCDDLDGKFLSGIRNEQERYRNDDKTLYGMALNSSHWNYIDQTRIVNTNAGNVGIGITEPREMLHISGDIKAKKIQAEEYCDPAGYNTAGKICMPTRIIAGDEAGMKCGAAGTAVTTIENNSVGGCAAVFPPLASAPITFNKTCPAGQAMVGVSNITGVICEALP